MDAGVVLGEDPGEKLTKVLEHVFGEEGSVGCHHPSHGVENGEESLEGLETLTGTLFSLSR